MDKDIKYILNHPKYSGIAKKALFMPLKESVVSGIRDFFFNQFLETLKVEYYEPLFRFFSTGDQKYLPKNTIGGDNGNDISAVIGKVVDISNSYSKYHNPEDDPVPTYEVFEYILENINDILKQINSYKKDGTKSFIIINRDIFKDNIIKSIDKRIERNKDEYEKRCKFLKKEYGCDNFDATEFVKGSLSLYFENTEGQYETAGGLAGDSYPKKDRIEGEIYINKRGFLEEFFKLIKFSPIDASNFQNNLNIVLSRMSSTIFHESYHICQYYLKKYGIMFGFQKKDKDFSEKKIETKDLLDRRKLENGAPNYAGLIPEYETTVNINKEAYYIFLKIKKDIEEKSDFPIFLKRKKDFYEEKSFAESSGYYYDLSGSIDIEIGKNIRKYKYEAFSSTLDNKAFVFFDMVESSPGKFSVKEFGKNKAPHISRDVEFYPNIVSILGYLLKELQLELFHGNKLYFASRFPEAIFDKSYMKNRSKIMEEFLKDSLYTLENVFKNASKIKRDKIFKYIKNFANNKLPEYYENWFLYTEDEVINNIWIYPISRGVLSGAKYLHINKVDEWLKDNYNKISLNKNFFSNLIANLDFSIYDLKEDFSDLKYENISRFAKEYGSDILKSYIINKIFKEYDKEEFSSNKINEIKNNMLSLFNVEEESFDNISKAINKSYYEVDKKTIFNVVKDIKPYEFFELELDKKYTERFPKLTILMLKNLEVDDFQILDINNTTIFKVIKKIQPLEFFKSGLDLKFMKNYPKVIILMLKKLTKDDFSKLIVKEIYNKEYLDKHFSKEHADKIINIINKKSEPKKKRKSRIFKSWNK